MKTRQPKKNKKYDIRQYSFIFFLIGLLSMISLADYALNFKTFFYPDPPAEVVVSDGLDAANREEEEEEFKVLQIDQHEIENLVNAVAYTHAQWPGYKGDETDGVSVRKHFSRNLAKYIVDSANLDDIYNVYRIHFYYIVRADGVIQYLAIREDGLTSEDLPQYLIEDTSELMSFGIPGIKAGTNDKGEPITVIYELLIKFTPS